MEEGYCTGHSKLVSSSAPIGYWIAGPRYIELVVSPRRVKPGAKSIRS